MLCSLYVVSDVFIDFAGDHVTGYDAESGRLVAVKRVKTEAISAGAHSPQQQFQNEINILSS